MGWQWWAAMTIYILGVVGGMSYAGVCYQRKVEEVRAKQDASPLTTRFGMEDAGAIAFGFSVAAIFWPVVSAVVVLYYGVTAPFWLGKWVEHRKVERRKALAAQHREQADNLRRMARDHAVDAIERKILLDSAQHLADRASTLK